MRTRLKFVIILGFFIGNLIIFSSVLAESSITFYIDSDFDYDERTEIEVTLHYTGIQAYFYIEDKWWNSQSQVMKNYVNQVLEDLSEEFDDFIYPEARGVFGSEWIPGIDGDSRIFVLFTQTEEGFGGYFRTVDEYTRDKRADSNEKEMFYISTDYLLNSLLKSSVAHELQHLISWNQKERIRGVDEEVWLNELRSEYIPTLLGYDSPWAESILKERISNFLSDPSDSLTEWKNLKPDYGQIALFGHYLVGYYGTDFLYEMMQAPASGISSIDIALSSLGYAENFSQAFSNWAIANYLNDSSIDGGKYSYAHPRLKDINITPKKYSIYRSSLISYTTSTKNWENNWYEFVAGGTFPENNILKIEFDAQGVNSNFQIPYVINNKDGSHEMGSIDLTGNQGTLYVPDFGDRVKSMVIIPSNRYKTSRFTSNEPSVYFSFSASLTDSMPGPVQPSYPNGSLVRAKGDYRVYIINDGFKRHIVNGRIFDFYGHLNWENIIEISSEELAFYKDSAWVRADGDKRVYEVNDDGTKHWLNMTAEQFTVSGRSWEAIYVINNQERNFYMTGVDVLYR